MVKLHPSTVNNLLIQVINHDGSYASAAAEASYRDSSSALLHLLHPKNACE